jgi:hypothetical protein
MNIRHHFETVIRGVMDELEECHPGLFEAMIDGVVQDRGCSQREAILELIQFGAALRKSLDARGVRYN